MSADPLSALFYPFESGAEQAPGGRILFLNGRACPQLARFKKGNVVIRQYFRPYAKTALAAGYAVDNNPEQENLYDAVFVLAPRQQEERRFLIAQAVLSLRPGGLLVVAAGNEEGGRRLLQDMESFDFPVASYTKHKSRVVCGRRPEKVSEQNLDEALAQGGAQKIIVDGEGFYTCPGLFSWNRVDTGSQILVQCIDMKDISDNVGDFGCGWGFLSHTILQSANNIKKLVCIDADSRAVSLCEKNIRDIKSGVESAFLWADITDRGDFVPSGLDAIVMNPPFHEGKAQKIEAGAAFIARAASCLGPGGVLWMVANAHLPYEDILSSCFADHQKIRQENGFKIIRAVK